MILKSCHDDLICWKWLRSDRKNDKFWSNFLGLFILKPIILTSARYTFYNYPILVRMIFFSKGHYLSKQSKGSDPASKVKYHLHLGLNIFLLLIYDSAANPSPCSPGTWWQKKFNRKMISILRKYLARASIVLVQMALFPINVSLSQQW